MNGTIRDAKTVIVLLWLEARQKVRIKRRAIRKCVNELRDCLSSENKRVDCGFPVFYSVSPF